MELFSQLSSLTMVTSFLTDHEDDSDLGGLFSHFSSEVHKDRQARSRDIAKNSEKNEIANITGLIH
jgi:hypothetical protein